MKKVTKLSDLLKQMLLNIVAATNMFFLNTKKSVSPTLMGNETSKTNKKKKLTAVLFCFVLFSLESVKQMLKGRFHF